MKKCKYCGNELNSTSEFCCNECESNYKEALEKDSRKTKYFILGIALGFLILLYGIALSNRASAIGIGIIVMGIDVVLLPFTTPEAKFGSLHPVPCRSVRVQNPHNTRFVKFFSFVSCPLVPSFSLQKL